MTPEQFEIFLERNEKSTGEAVERFVNGKIRDLTALVKEHNAKHEADMADLKPIIVEYKERVAARSYAKKVGDTVKWTAGLATAIGVLWMALKSIIKGQ